MEPGVVVGPGPERARDLTPATAALVRRVREGVIGEGAALSTPFGTVPVVYADWTASGRALDLIEDALRRDVLPWYANTHSEASGTGRITSGLREQARAAVRSSVGGDDDTAVLFCGSGATAAIDKLVTMLGLRVPPALDRRHRWSEQVPLAERPVVLVGPYEHHSNELAWRESIAEVVVVGEDERGGIDAAELEGHLVRCAGRPLIGSFSAASNVTGVLSDVDGISALLHAHGALACWDYAAAAPYVDVAFSAPGGAHRDAAFLSPHKLLGGPGAPGVLVVRRSAVDHLDVARGTSAGTGARRGARPRVPAVPGGGTVSYVSPSRHVYVHDLEHAEEGGTPDIVGSVRAGLVFALKDAVGVPAIRALDDAALARMLDAWAGVPELQLLGRLDAPRLPIVSFLVRAPSGRYLHHGFVVALLNDLFGVQARGGCSCAGPYGHRLLGIDAETSERHATLIEAGLEGAKPGWVRVSASWSASAETIDHLIEAVTLVARHGWRMLALYRFDARTGAWRHRDAASATHVPHAPPLTLGLDVVGLDVAPPLAPPPGPSLPECRRTARELLLAPVADVPAGPPLPEPMEALRWFELAAGELAAGELAAEELAPASGAVVRQRGHQHPAATP